MLDEAVDAPVPGLPVSSVFPAPPFVTVLAAGTEAEPKVEPMPVRYAYGGKHCVGAAGAGSQVFTGDPPSTARRARPTHTLFEVVVGCAQVHWVDGHSATVVQRMVLS